MNVRSGNRIRQLGHVPRMDAARPTQQVLDQRSNWKARMKQMTIGMVTGNRKGFKGNI